MELEEIVYRGYGQHQRKGGGYSTLGVKSTEELEKALADGWYRTLPEAIDAHDNKVVRPTVVTASAEPVAMVAPVAPVVELEIAPVVSEKAPDKIEIPTDRQALEDLADKLGVEFHPSLGDAKLTKRVLEAIKVEHEGEQE